ncbi:AEC family transporter [Novosphingobium sp. PS1R-30]|uniref:AEC family transporter n=1 Tax=Novosphingobium anseongense TaxID=3133436 RepID=A0ABU8S0Y4_9SPHN
MTDRVLVALVPIVLLMMLGALLRRTSLLADDFWPQAERLGYYVLLPCLFFHDLATAQVGHIPIYELVLTLIAATALVAAIVTALRPVMHVDGPAFTSVFQGSVRFNNFIGVSLMSELFGASGVALAAVCNAAVVPTVNILCVLIFSRFGITRLGPGATVRQIASNPLIIASLAGVLWQVTGWSVTDGLSSALRLLGLASLPLGLLCVGSALQFGQFRSWLKPIVWCSMAKFVAMPVATLVLGRIFGLCGVALMTAMLFQSLPTSSSSYVMARQLGGDAPLMATITAAQTLLAMLAMPIVAALLL